MVQELSRFEPVELSDEIRLSEGVCFDPDNVNLRGCYGDEISAYRAKRLWVETLENCFLLEHDYDFSVAIHSDLDKVQFVLVCQFHTACARYAFWRLTNHQAPEAQYAIETAHIPVCDSRQEDILRAPDLRCIREDPMVIRGEPEATVRGITSLLQSIIARFRG